MSRASSFREGATSPAPSFQHPADVFRPLTEQSLTRIGERIKQEEAIKEREKEKELKEEDKEKEEVKPRPYNQFAAGCILPRWMPDFPKDLIGKPIEDIDDFYRNVYTFIVIGRDRCIYRFSATKAFFALSPFHPVRRGAIFVLSHPIFSNLVMLTILINCVFMCLPNEYPTVEKVFTVLYTCEALVKLTARGLFLKPFTYFRDPWNWLDFIVIAIAYITWSGSSANLSALRAFRVLRVLKTVAVVPGLKTIVGALIEAVRRLRDVSILTLFMLTIFSLIGLQLYGGTLQRKCVKQLPEYLQNVTDKEKTEFWLNESNWYVPHLVCGRALCPENFTCQKIGRNPNFGYTHYDNFLGGMLCSFRLVVQDYWENLYVLTLRANGEEHIIFFIIVILLGSFCLVNLILAIVAMSYEEVRKSNMDEKRLKIRQQEELEAAAAIAEAEFGECVIKRIPSDYSCHSIANEVPGKGNQGRPSLSLPRSPYFHQRLSRASQISWRRHRPSQSPLDPYPRAQSYLEHMTFPYADDATPDSEEPRAPPTLYLHRRRLSSVSHHTQTLHFDDGLQIPQSSRRPSLSSRRSSRHSRGSISSFRMMERPKEPTYFHWGSGSMKKPSGHGSRKGDETKELPEERPLSPYTCRTPSTFQVESRDMSKKEKLRRKLEELMSYECHPYVKRFSHYVELIVTDAFMELFITLCIVINTLFMTIDKPHEEENPMKEFLETGNMVLTIIFAFEALLKLIGLGVFRYLRDRWNCFDLAIVLVSLVEILIIKGKKFSILRSFRLLRVFKLAKSWPTLNMLISIISRTLAALGNLTLVLAIIIFIFAVTGMQLFGEYYRKMDPEEQPRWNFTDFWHSFMIVFRVLCGEWIESMWNCMHIVSPHMCVPFFLLTMVAGNLVVLNLFLALLLSSFGAENLQMSEDDSAPNKLQEAIARIRRFCMYVKAHTRYQLRKRLCCRRRKRKSYDNGCVVNEVVVDGQLCTEYHEVSTPGSNSDNLSDSKGSSGFGQSKKERSAEPILHNTLAPVMVTSGYGSLTPSQGSRSDVRTNSTLEHSRDTAPMELLDRPGVDQVQVVFSKYPEDCFPSSWMRRMKIADSFVKTKFGRRFWSFRCYMFQMVEHKYFETFIIFMVLTSSFALVFDDKFLDPDSQKAQLLKVLDKLYCVIFAMEMVIKWAAFGWKKYFTDAWCCLDFIIVTISIVTWVLEARGMTKLMAFRALRTLRSLRPLRAVSRWEGMRVVVNALIQAIPSILNVLLVCMVFWLIFSIMGVQLFGGRFAKCLDENGKLVNASIVPNKSVCESDWAKNLSYKWVHSSINFDNTFNGYLALLQVATFKGWTVIMDDAVDCMEPGQQQVKENKVLSYLYFVIFIVFGSFFTLNLFIGVIIENFNKQKAKIRGSLEMFLTEDQKRYYNAMKKLGTKKPQKAIPKPRFKVQRFFFKLATYQKFDIGILLIIVLNMLTMAIEHQDMDKSLERSLQVINMVFISIFTLECVFKIIGMRWYYFKEAWNIFDFVVVTTSLITTAMQHLMKQFHFNTTLLRVIRIFRIGRVLRLVKSAKGIRTLLLSLAVSLPALFNIGLLLFLVIFIYSILGMNFFKDVPPTHGLDDMFNFQTFIRSVITLFQICTSAGWDGVLAGLTACDDETKCPNSAGAVFFLVTYLVITFLVVINMYIAVILEHFTQATEDVQQGLTQDDIDMYYEIWEKFDEQATHYIDLSHLSTFVSTLEEPLVIHQPNYYKLVHLDILICRGDKVHCVDILDALTKNYLGTEDDNIGDIKKGPEKENYFPVSSTLMRQREKVCARIVQRFLLRCIEAKRRVAERDKSDERTDMCTPEITVEDKD